jgi:hypothetical protein
VSDRGVWADEGLASSGGDAGGVAGQAPGIDGVGEGVRELT